MTTSWGFPLRSVLLSCVCRSPSFPFDSISQQRWTRWVGLKNIRRQLWRSGRLRSSDNDWMSDVSINCYCWRYYLDSDGDVLLLLSARLLCSVDILWCRKQDKRRAGGREKRSRWCWQQKLIKVKANWWGSWMKTMALATVRSSGEGKITGLFN